MTTGPEDDSDSEGGTPDVTPMTTDTTPDKAQLPANPTNEQIEEFAAVLHAQELLPWWLGFRTDAEGRYTIPVVSKAVCDLIRAALTSSPSAPPELDWGAPSHNPAALAQRLVEDWHEGVPTDKLRDWGNAAAGRLAQLAALSVPAAAPQSDAQARGLLQEFVDLCAAGDIDEDTDDGLGWGALVRGTKAFLGTLGACPSGTALCAPAPSGRPLQSHGAKVRQLISELLGIPLVSVVPAASFYGDLGADSLDAIELVMAVEDEFGIEISDEAAEVVCTVQQAIDLVERMTAAPTTGEQA